MVAGSIPASGTTLKQGKVHNASSASAATKLATATGNWQIDFMISFIFNTRLRQRNSQKNKQIVEHPNVGTIDFREEYSPKKKLDKRFLEIFSGVKKTDPPILNGKGMATSSTP
ncbi:MAG: hypothetical protein DVB32_06885 [Verrucomicrobia bacterium]|nr:MAG: hypothetical protein DVB32_06885 [Verrucomicrobiota bacterium]